jgi:hypothetical protein
MERCERGTKSRIKKEHNDEIKMSKFILFRNIVRVMKSKEMGAIYSTH